MWETRWRFSEKTTSFSEQGTASVVLRPRSDLSNGKEIFAGGGRILPSGRIKILQKFARCVKLFEPEKNGRAGVAELADAPDLGSGGFTVGVQVPSPAPLLIGRLRGFPFTDLFTFCLSVKSRFASGSRSLEGTSL